MLQSNLAKKNAVNNFLNDYFSFFVVIFVSFLLFISYFLILKPKVDITTAAISENISSNEKLLQAEKHKLQSLQAAIKAYDEVDPDDLARVNAILPDEYDKEALFGEIEEIINKNGFIVSSINLSQQEDDGLDPNNKIGVIDVSINVLSADYAGAKNLLNILESNLRMFDVKELSVGGSSATLKFSTYYKK